MTVLAGFPNARDLAGWGGVQPGRVLRAGTPATLTAADREQAVGFGWALIADLRSDAEIVLRPHPLSALAAYRRLPLIDPAAEARRLSAQEPVALTYRGSITRNASYITAIFRAIAGAGNGPVLVCCTAGRDRTGMICALMLDLVGTDRAAIAADYAQSPPSVEQVEAGRVGGRDIEDMLDHVRSTWGSTGAYLTWLGLSAAEIDQLATLLQRSSDETA